MSEAITTAESVPQDETSILEKGARSGSPPTAPEREDGRKKPLAFHMSFLGLLIMCFIVSIDGTILAVAIPIIAQDLHATTLQAFWASISFVLAVVVVQPIYTSASDVLGRKGPLYASFFWFTLGSILFATAPNMAVLIASRAIQGLGAGGLDVLNEIILADITTLKERPLYLGYLAIPMAGGSILGPIVGGLFSEYVTWRWIGWINLPISALGFILVFFFLKLRSIDQPFRTRLARLDFIGMALFAIGCTLFATPLTWAGAMFPWSSWKTILPLILGALFLAAFAWYESKPANPVIPHRIFESRTASVTLAASFLHGAVTYSSVLYTPLFYQAVYLEDPLKSAISILPLCCSSVFFGIIAAVAIEVIRKYKFAILGSWICAAVGIGLFALWGRNSSLAIKVSAQIILGIGTGSLFSILNLPLQASTTRVDDMGLAAGTLCSFRLFGGLLGLSMCSTVFSNVFAQRMSSLASFGPLPDAVAMLRDIREAVGFVPLLGSVRDHVDVQLFVGIVEAYRKAFIALFLMLAGISVVGFAASLFIREISLEKEELGRQQFEDSQ
ncbi:MFS general substrate transporter [Ophiobolus disseminans]|uniref:MFS general substrate transporter n=1 Tax=Ophiobolus disseminans TaxID=1469910 RepID=A0A6A7A9B5_9PLEO|nr:MFS general substrate transporter [Ophiobolus disseminans]